MPEIKKRLYKSLVRQRQAGDTRPRIVEATRQLLQSEGYAGMTVEGIAQRAEARRLIIGHGREVADPSEVGLQDFPTTKLDDLTADPDETRMPAL